MAEREQKLGICDQCSKDFRYYLVHNGFNESWYVYCDLCGKTAILNLYSPKISELWSTRPIQGRIPHEIESHLLPCSCGGRFLAAATPRCPHCIQPLSPVTAASWIEKEAPGAKKGWRWQKNWDGLYCIVIERCSVRDNFV
jgi:predicted amidophosphoribosyltransferase